mgnify:CR=1 FL=1
MAVRPLAEVAGGVGGQEPGPGHAGAARNQAIELAGTVEEAAEQDEPDDVEQDLQRHVGVPVLHDLLAEAAEERITFCEESV